VLHEGRGGKSAEDTDRSAGACFCSRLVYQSVILVSAIVCWKVLEEVDLQKVADLEIGGGAVYLSKGTDQLSCGQK
jgi:hypothetical protein